MTIHETAVLVQALKNHELYNHPVMHFQVLETHISWVILTGPFAYKIKKPVNLGFVDFSTLEKRYAYCQEEVRLNKRLAPELYLGVVPISGSSDCPVLYSADQPIEYAVQMLEFPKAAMLDQIVARGDLELKHLDQLAIDIARFHGTIAVADADSPFGAPQMISQVVQEVIDQFSLKSDRGFSPGDSRTVFDWITHEHLKHIRTFADRKEQGFVRECHGDMHLANLVLLQDHIVPFDGIEFSERLRWIDVMNDLAFPVMDCIARGSFQAAYRLLNKYLEETGDYAGLRVFRYYQVYRALVRAKVACISLNQSGIEQEKEQVLTDRVRCYFTLAQELMTSGSQGIVLMHGISGVGKTTISQTLLESIGAIRVRSDIERKRLGGLNSTARSQGQQKEWMYGPQTTEATYHRLFELTGIVLEAGYPVIVDATFLQERFRARFRKLADARSLPFIILAAHASHSTVRERVASRLSQGYDASDADVQVVLKQEGSQERLKKWEIPFVIRVNSGEAFNPKVIHDVLARRTVSGGNLRDRR